MKKLSLYLMIFVASWSLTACDEHHDDYAQPPVYSQEELYDIDGFTATPTAASAAPIDLGTMSEDGVQLFTLTMGTLPKGITFENLRLEAWPADKSESVATNVVASEDGKVTREALAQLVYTFYGKKVTERTFKAKLLGNAVKGTESQLITLGDFTLRITPEYLESPYYFVFGKVNVTTAKEANRAIMTPDPNNDQKFSFTSMFASSSDILVWNEKYWNTATNNGTKNAVAADYDKVYGMSSQEEANQKEASGKIFQGLPDGTSIPVYFLAPTKEYYTFTIDLEAQTFTWTLLENQSPTIYSSMKLAGLPTDVTMTSVGVGGKTGISTKKHNWYALNVNVATDAMVSFVSGNTTWGYGDSDGSWTVDETEWYKTCSENGKHIKLPAGKYNVYFCDITGTAEFMPLD